MQKKTSTNFKRKPKMGNVTVFLVHIFLKVGMNERNAQLVTHALVDMYARQQLLATVEFLVDFFLSY